MVLKRKVQVSSKIEMSNAGFFNLTQETFQKFQKFLKLNKLFTALFSR